VTINGDSYKEFGCHLLVIRTQNKFGDYLCKNYLLGNMQRCFWSQGYRLVGTNDEELAKFVDGDEIEVIFVDELSIWKL
jgi:hypothetical protein